MVIWLAVIVVFLCVIYTGGYYICCERRRFFRQERTGRMAEFEGTIRNLKNEMRKLGEIDREVRERELSLVGLYEFTKRMSPALRFDEIFDALRTFFLENPDRFAFKRGELIVLKDAVGSYEVSRVYELLEAAPAEKDPASTEKVETSTNRSSYGIKELLKLCEMSRKGIFLKSKEAPGIFRALGIAEGAATFAAMPLMNENRIAAVLAVEDMPQENFEKFAILSIQFAMEMKKVLLYETVESLAITDGLTGLYGRRYFVSRLEEEIVRSKTHDLKFSFLMGDIDFFKACNDTYGHLVGDAVLKEIARLIKETVREVDLVARYGGEEFGVILPETKKDGGVRVAERIRRKIEEHVFRAYDETLKITISIGVSAYSDDAEEAAALIDSADKAMYRAKSDGRNLVRT